MQLYTDFMLVYVCRADKCCILTFFFKRNTVNRLALQTAPDEVEQRNRLAGVLGECSFAIRSSFVKPRIWKKKKQNTVSWSLKAGQYHVLLSVNVSPCSSRKTHWASTEHQFLRSYYHAGLNLRSVKKN